MTFVQKATPSSGFSCIGEGSKDAEDASASFEPLSIH
jgi:hypothetical protein